MKLNIVMVEPEIPQNTGNVARTCAATGAKLHLVKPLGFSIDDKYLKRAGLDYWDKLDIEIHENLEAFLNKYTVGADDSANACCACNKQSFNRLMDVRPGQAQDLPPLHISDDLNKKLSKYVCPNNMFLASTKSQQTYADIDYKQFDEIFVLFGKETKGLPEDLIENNMKQAIRIPMKEGLRSLNLSNSVAIVTYEILRQNNFKDLQQISDYF